MNEFVRHLETSGDLTGAFSFVDIVSVILLSFLLSTVLGYAYRYTHRGVSYSQTYVHTLIIIGTVIALVMLVIGSNIARAFALVGSLSIIRFRNAMKEPRDIAFLFCVMAVGMAVGTRFYALAVVGDGCIEWYRDRPRQTESLRQNRAGAHSTNSVASRS